MKCLNDLLRSDDEEALAPGILDLELHLVSAIS